MLSYNIIIHRSTTRNFLRSSCIARYGFRLAQAQLTISGASKSVQSSKASTSSSNISEAGEPIR